MSRIITIASQKGGVGKTTTALNLGYGLSRAGKRTLVIDGDPQGGLTAACNLKKKTARGLLHVLEEEIDAASHPAGSLFHENLAILGSGAIDANDISRLEEAAEQGQLVPAIQRLAAGFEYVLLDAPVGVGRIARALLSASDFYLIVINCKAGTMKTLPRMMRTAEWVRAEVKPDLRFLGVLVNMYDGDSSPEKKIYAYFKASLSRNFFFDTVIPLDDRFERASFHSVPVAMLRQGENPFFPHASLARELLARTADTAAPGGPASAGEGGPRRDEDDFFMDRLQELCEKNGYSSALLADEMGLSLTSCNCTIDTDALAAFTSVLADSLEKAESVLDQEDPNNITLEVNESDRIILHRFKALNSTYFLLLTGPRAAVFPGTIEETVAAIRARLTG